VLVPGATWLLLLALAGLEGGEWCARRLHPLPQSRPLPPDEAGGVGRGGAVAKPEPAQTPETVAEAWATSSHS
jgi:hypothetical protein